MRNRIAHRSGREAMPIPTVVAHAIGCAIVLAVASAPAISGQSGSSSQSKFEVASIRSSNGCTVIMFGAPSPGRLEARCDSVRQLIHRAYAVFQTGLVNPQAAATPIEGGPAWIDSDRYDITAKAQGDVTVALMGGPMLRTLLEDRFKLRSTGKSGKSRFTE